MVLWLDRPSQPPDGPRTHALVIGTSRYDHLPEKGQPAPVQNETFDLVQARSPAAGAFRFARWLRDSYANPTAPIGTIDLYLSPSDAEVANDAELGKAAGTTRSGEIQQAIYAWRTRCSGQRDGVAIFYASGHGIEVSKQDHVVLLQDFAKDPRVLEGAVDVGSVFYGMRGGHLPSRQFYFVDACRIRPDAFNRYANLGVGVGLDELREGDETRTAPVYFSASVDTAALGVPGIGTIFSQALIESLGGLAVKEFPDDQQRWHVDSSSLQKALEVRVKELALEHNDVQDVVTGGYVRTTPFHYYPEPPELTVTFRLDPDAAAHVAHACVKGEDEREEMPRSRFVPNPLPATIRAGFYSLEVSIDPPTPPFRERRRPLPVIPASVRQPITVSVLP